MTVFEAECDMHSGIVRIYAYAESGSAYLGVMVPQNGKLTLRKKCSREAMRAFPKNIEYAADAILKKPEKTEPPEENELLWFHTPEGFLTAFDGAQSLIAIPSALKESPITRRINGREYAIFPGKRKM